MLVKSKVLCLNYIKSQYDFKNDKGEQIKGVSFKAELYDDESLTDRYLKLKVDQNSAIFKELKMDTKDFMSTVIGKQCEVTISITSPKEVDKVRVVSLTPLE